VREFPSFLEFFEFSRVNAAIEKRDVKLASKISRWTAVLPVNGSRVTVYSIDCSLAEVASGWQLASNCGSGQTNIHGKDARRGRSRLPSPLIKPSNCQTSDRAFKHRDKVAFRPFTCEIAGSVTPFFFSFLSSFPQAPPPRRSRAVISRHRELNDIRVSEFFAIAPSSASL